MRHNQNGRRYRGRGNGGGGQNHHHNNGGGNHNHGQRRINPRVHTFDSNGPDVRIRGNAYQITEKYLALAKDASSAGDRVLAESYLQHAEHYQRLINELSDDYSRNQPQGGQQQHHQGQHQNQQAQGDAQPAIDPADGEQPVIDGGLVDLDQGFLVGPRKGQQKQAAGAAAAGEDEQPPAAPAPTPRAARAAKSAE